MLQCLRLSMSAGLDEKIHLTFAAVHAIICDHYDSGQLLPLNGSPVKRLLLHRLYSLRRNLLTISTFSDNFWTFPSVSYKYRQRRDFGWAARLRAPNNWGAPKLS